MSEDLDRLERGLAALPRELRERYVAGTTRLHLPANVPPWTDTGLALEADETWSVFADGRVVLSEEAGLWNGPALCLWGRVGKRGPLHNGTRATGSFATPHAGPLELCIYSGEWGDRDGTLATPTDGYAALSGGIDVLVVRWRGPARAAVDALGQALPGDPLLRSESGRLADPATPPPGWHYLWFLGPAEIYRPATLDGAPAIRARTHDDVGILQYPVDLPLRDDTVLRWRWRVHELPSATAEDTLPSHDYLSIAVEFDDGRDLTYYWSAALAPGTVYRCPLPSWDQRETHQVVRSGSEGLGEWHDEAQPLRSDYAHAIGEPPARVVAVWLIAVSLFQKRGGRADFADIRLESAGESIQVL